MTSCVNTLDPFFCGLIQRDAQTTLWLTPNGRITDLTQNIGALRTRGLDINASYSIPAGTMGSFGLTFVGTWLDKLTVDTGVGPIYECRGLYGNVCGTPSPKWRHQVRLTWTGPHGIGASLRWRYFSSVSLFGGGAPVDGVLPSQSYLDLALTFRINDHYAFRLGSNNILDRDPPTSGQVGAGFGNGNTYPQVYDALGRYIYAGVTLDF